MPEEKSPEILHNSRTLRPRRSIHQLSNDSEDVVVKSPKKKVTNKSKNDSSIISESSINSNKLQSSKEDKVSDSDVENSENSSDDESEEVEVKKVYCPKNTSTPKFKKPVDKIQEKHNINKPLVYIILICVMFVCVLCLTNNSTLSGGNSFSLDMLKKKFPSQDDSLWLSIKSGVEDVITLNRPSTFILLYSEEAEQNLNNLVENLSKYGTCIITSCLKKPIVLTDADLNSSEVVRDYGILIEKYRDLLRESGVMIIKNLEKVKGVSAQAFHSFCDEYNPLVDKSLFIFTMKVTELPESKDQMRFVEEYFKNKWTDIKADSFHPLITRITSMVLEVKA